jgi:hypothetical protein
MQHGYVPDFIGLEYLHQLFDEEIFLVQFGAAHQRYTPFDEIPLNI